MGRTSLSPYRDLIMKYCAGRGALTMSDVYRIVGSHLDNNLRCGDKTCAQLGYSCPVDEPRWKHLIRHALQTLKGRGIAENVDHGWWRIRDPEAESPEGTIAARAASNGRPGDCENGQTSELTIRLTEGRVARLAIPSAITYQDIEILQRYVEVLSLSTENDPKKPKA